jgi:hypothetical protein
MLFSVELEQPKPFSYLEDHGVDMRAVLHGEQSFEYRTLAFAGERLTSYPHIAEVTVKRDGALTLVRKRSRVLRANGEVVADLESTILVRSLEAVK